MSNQSTWAPTNGASEQTRVGATVSHELPDPLGSPQHWRISHYALKSADTVQLRGCGLHVSRMYPARITAV